MTIYLIIGITGYLTFGNTTKSNIISMYPPSNKFVLGGQTLMALMVCVSYALQCNPARKSFGNVINYIRTMKRRSGYEPLHDGEESPLLRTNDDSNNSSLLKTKSQPSLTTPLNIKNPQDSSNNFASSSLNSNASSSSEVPQVLKDRKIGISKSYNDLYYLLRNKKEYQYHSIDMPPNEINTHSIESQSFELSNTLHNVITTCLLTISYIIACSVSDLGVVLSVVGATGSTTICFILPSLLYYKIKKNERGNQKSTFLMKIALAISIIGVLLMMNSLFFIFVKI
jgi:amino acid permease